jgi:hypothetical protein
VVSTASRVSLVACPLVDSVWPFVTYGLEHACMKGGGDIGSDYLWGLCRSGGAYLFVVADGEHVIGASVWNFEKWSSGRKFRCLAAYGQDRDNWLEQMRDLVRKAARDGGATALVADGRLGWARVFPEAKVLRQTYEIVI